MLGWVCQQGVDKSGSGGKRGFLDLIAVNNHRDVATIATDLLGTAEQSGDTADGAITAVVAEKAEKLVASGLLTRAQASALMRAKDVQAALETKVASLLNGGIISDAEAEAYVAGVAKKEHLRGLAQAGVITPAEAESFARPVFRSRVLAKIRAAVVSGTITEGEANAALRYLTGAPDTADATGGAESTVPVAETDVVDSTIEGVIKSKSLMEVFEMASRIGDIEESEMSDLRDKLLGEDGVQFENDLDAAIDFLGTYANSMPSEMAEMQSAILTRISAVESLLNQVTGVEEEGDLNILGALTSPVEEGVVTPQIDAEYLAASDPMPLVRDALPAGMRVVEKPDMIGTMGFSDSTPDVIYVNPKLLAEALEGLSPENARYVVRTLTAHELGHKAAEMTNEQYNEYAAELGDAGLAKAADAYYSVAYPDPAKRARAIARDRADTATSFLERTITRAPANSPIIISARLPSPARTTCA